MKKKKKKWLRWTGKRIGQARSSPLPCLSPVKTQILILALFRVIIVSGTPSCSLSSMAVAPNSFEQKYQCVRQRKRLTAFSGTQQLDWHLSILFSKLAVSWHEDPNGIKLTTLCPSTDSFTTTH